ncbi:MAG: hypothetical protein IPM39_07015 [Chloroflexi bacterium]|nr:hypothetical protein [Chloroflexota bacterium]
MNGQLKLSVEQVVVAIEMLSPAEKRKIQRRLSDIFGNLDYTNLPDVEEQSPIRQETQPVYPYSFLESRKLLRDVHGNLSAEIIADREDRL